MALLPNLRAISLKQQWPQSQFNMVCTGREFLKWGAPSASDLAATAAPKHTVRSIHEPGLWHKPFDCLQAHRLQLVLKVGIGGLVTRPRTAVVLSKVPGGENMQWKLQGSQTAAEVSSLAVKGFVSFVASEYAGVSQTCTCPKLRCCPLNQWQPV